MIVDEVVAQVRGEMKSDEDDEEMGKDVRNR